jgi:hypothetical protein
LIGRPGSGPNAAAEGERRTLAPADADVAEHPVALLG